jgi:hypothetical protein
VRKWLRKQLKDFYAAGFDTLVKRWDKCINVGGAYTRNKCFFFRFEYHMFYVLYPFVTSLLTLPRTFWDKTPCILLKINRTFGRTCCLYLQDRIISHARNHDEAFTASCWFLVWMLIRLWIWRLHVPLKLRLNFNVMQGVISPRNRTLQVRRATVRTPCSVMADFGHLLKSINLAHKEE